MPLVGIGTLPTPFSPASVPLPPETGGRGILCDVYVHFSIMYSMSLNMKKTLGPAHCNHAKQLVCTLYVYILSIGTVHTKIVYI
jgi:hypothetical protein